MILKAKPFYSGFSLSAAESAAILPAAFEVVGGSDGMQNRDQDNDSGDQADAGNADEHHDTEYNGGYGMVGFEYLI